MLPPPQLRKHSARERRKAKERIRREAQRQRQRQSFLNNAGHNTAGKLAFVILLLLTTGGLLLTRVTRPPQRNAMHSPAMVAYRELNNLKTALNEFASDCGRYPSEEEGLHALINNPGLPQWQGPYVNLIRPDPWGNHYILSHHPDGRVTVASAGADRKTNTTADLVFDLD